MLKKILIALVILVAGFAGVVALQPSRVQGGADGNHRGAAGPGVPARRRPAQVRCLVAVANFDPNAKVGFDGPATGKGAVFTWSGNDKVGEGRMTVVESRPAELVKIDVNFVKPFGRLRPNRNSRSSRRATRPP